MMTTDKVGLYIHVPYCVRKCNYCDFCSLGGSDGVPREYIDRLCEELEGYKREEPITVDSIFFGGGTPSLMTFDAIGRVLSVVKECFTVLPNSEITIEANPGTVGTEWLREVKALGVNRLSFGVQSIHENELKTLGRIHSREDFFDCFSAARAAWFDNISVDLMYGIPHQTKESLAKTLDVICSLSPEHISLYGLMIEEGTPFAERVDELELPDEDEECSMYYFAHNYLTERGYSHYEISNYAAEGRQSRHNLKYWRGDDYIGIGASAHSFFEGARFYNTSSVSDYLSGEGLSLSECSVLTEEDRRTEFIMLRLRLSEGFSVSEFEERFGEEHLSSRREIIDRFSDEGLLKLCNGRIALTERGFYLSNLVIGELI